MTQPSADTQPDQPADHLQPGAVTDDTPPGVLLGLRDPTPHPWARYWAKMVDTALFSFVAGLIMTLGGWDGRSADILIWAVFVTLFPLVEAALIARFTGTPGKAVFAITVTAQGGARLPIRAAIARSYGAVLWGMGLGIPLLSLIAMVWGYRDYTTKQLNRWDRDAGAVYRARPTGQSWIVFCIILLVLFIFAFLAAAAAVMQE